MKLIFKYRYYNASHSFHKFLEGYHSECKSLREESELSEQIEDKEFMSYVLKNNMLNEVYLANYLDSVDFDLAEYVLKKLNDEKIDYCDAGSQAWDVELENNKVIITIMCSSEEDERACINRKEVVYAMLKWKKFLERKFDNPNYQEIIDTEDVYKE